MCNVLLLVGIVKVAFCDWVCAACSHAGNPHRYYVHYNDFNRRMDEWVPFSNFRLPDGSLPPLNDDGSPMPVESTRLGASGVDGLPDNKRVRIKKKDDTVGEFIEVWV